MVISERTQLGLRFKQNECKIDFLHILEASHSVQVEKLREILDKAQNEEISDEEINSFALNPVSFEKQRKISDKVNSLMPGDGWTYIMDDKDTKYFFICSSVYKAAELIKIGENFTGRTLKDIKFGSYTYLMSKHEMLRLHVVIGAIKGFYYNDKENIAFEFGIELENGEYYFEEKYVKLFSTIMQILTFVELGDIEVKILESGRNNGGKKDVDKITNSTNRTVFVVDSSWNTLVIRTDGFAVRGHFRLQPCGASMADRKLIWIDAFEKNGYTRKPTGQIVA